jgi:phosphoribosylformimino-5-aminoimidazole carboxamide ribotide isomerase
MQVIPVLDLLDGHAVRAVRGERAHYLPIQSSLCAGSDPLPLAHALLAASRARVLYIADLGAIQRRGDHAATLAALCTALGGADPGMRIWLDAGYADYPAMDALFERIARLAGTAAAQCQAMLVPVFGTESLRVPAALKSAADAGYAPILSLDHRAGQLIAEPVLGTAPAGCAPAWWPARLIVMTLDQVGSYAGPDLQTLARIQALAGKRSIVGAGGIRHGGDLASAARSGASAWLIASALHDRRLDSPPATHT